MSEVRIQGRRDQLTLETGHGQKNSDQEDKNKP